MNYKGDARIIRSTGVEELAKAIFDKQLSFKEADKIKKGEYVEFDVGASILNSILRFVYMKENDELDIRRYQGHNYTYEEMKADAEERYLICKEAITTMQENRWRFKNTNYEVIYEAAQRALATGIIPVWQYLNKMEEFYNTYKNNPYCNKHVNIFKRVLNMNDPQRLADKKRIKELEAVLDMMEDELNKSFLQKQLNQQIDEYFAKYEEAYAS